MFFLMSLLIKVIQSFVISMVPLCWFSLNMHPSLYVWYCSCFVWLWVNFISVDILCSSFFSYFEYVMRLRGLD